MPWTALTFLTLYLQLRGMSDLVRHRHSSSLADHCHLMQCTTVELLTTDFVEVLNPYHRTSVTLHNTGF